MGKKLFVLRREVVPKLKGAAARVVVAWEALTQSEREDGYVKDTTGLPAELHSVSRYLHNASLQYNLNLT